ncbi:tumor necrosis factor ligand superfamily member 13-like [Aplochiton taeniatus]
MAIKWYGSNIPYAIPLAVTCICLGLIVLQSPRVTQLEKEVRELRRNAFVHLHPLSSHSNDEEDYTLVKWTVGRSLGEDLLVSGETVTVVTEGIYFIYSQVLYKDTTWTMGHVIKKRLQGKVSSLIKCIQSMPSNITVAQNTCFTAGVHYLEPGSTLELIIPRKSARLVLKAHSTFLGMFRI